MVSACLVHHIVPLAAGGTNDDANLQPLCVNCHPRKTVLCDGGFGRDKKPMVGANENGAGNTSEWM